MVQIITTEIKERRFLKKITYIKREEEEEEETITIRKCRVK